MQRQPSYCDFCGFPVVSKEYPTDRRGINWYACADCARIIDVEDWNGLVERGVAAYAQMRSIPDDEKPLLRKRAERLVENFRIVRLVTA